MRLRRPDDCRSPPLASIRDELTSTETAPLLWAGITTYNALRNAGLRSGDLVAVQGVGGLGHPGIQFVQRMGFRTVALARGADKEKLAKDLGANTCTVSFTHRHLS